MYFEDEEWDGLENLKQPFTPAFANRNRFTYIKDGERLRAHAHAATLNKAQVPPSPIFPSKIFVHAFPQVQRPKRRTTGQKKGSLPSPDPNRRSIGTVTPHCVRRPQAIPLRRSVFLFFRRVIASASRAEAGCRDRNGTASRHGRQQKTGGALSSGKSSTRKEEVDAFCSPRPCLRTLFLRPLQTSSEMHVAKRDITIRNYSRVCVIYKATQH